ncbi:MAG: YDG domain-containing protein, partial [Bacteroidales bacterium]|nr:YDG domain-containing protein [Bacteroidales bacterium]
MKTFKKLLVMLAFLGLSMTAKSQPNPTGTFDLSTGTWTSGGSAACLWNDPVLTVGDGANIIITGTSTDERRIEVDTNAKEVNITLDGVRIEGLFVEQSPILLKAGAEVTVTLAEGTANFLKGGFFFAGIQVPDSAALTINGLGSLEAIGGWGAAGIGAAYEGKCGSITINSGNVTAVGGKEMLKPASLDALLTLAASATPDQFGNIVISWITNRDAGNFTVELSADGTVFNTTVNTQSAAVDLFNYSYPYDPQSNENDLYLRVIQTDGTDTAESNIVKMYYLEDIGYVTEIDIADSTGVDIEKVYSLAMITAQNSLANVKVSKLVWEDLVDDYESIPMNIMDNDLLLLYITAVSYGLPHYFGWYTGPAIEIPTLGTPLSLFSNSTLEYTFPSGNAPTATDDLTLCFIVSFTIPGINVTVGVPIPISTILNIESSYDENTRTFTSTLPFPGRYIITKAVPAAPGGLTIPEPEPEPPTEWKPTSELAKIVYAAGFAYDLDSKMLYARMDASQRELGFCYFYDEMIPLISSNISCEPIYFYYNNKEWLVEIWKGQYGIELGAEIGVYNRPVNGDLVIDRIEGNYKAVVAEIIRQTKQLFPNIPNNVMNVLTNLTNTVTDHIGVRQFEDILQAAFNTLKNLEKIDVFDVTPAAYARDAVGAVLFGLRSKMYDSAAENFDGTANDERLLMKYRILTSDGNNLETVFERGPEKHWWLTGFNWGMYTEKPHQLTMDATIWFPTEKMRNAFISTDANDYTTEIRPFSLFDVDHSEQYAFYNNDNSNRVKRGLIGMGYRHINEAAFLGSGENQIYFSHIDDIFANWSSLFDGSHIFLMSRYDLAMKPVYETFNENGLYAVRFLVRKPLAKQPFITTQAAPFVNMNNQQWVYVYNSLKEAVGCTSNDPNDLEANVLKYVNDPAISVKDREYIKQRYTELTGIIRQIVEAAFEVAKAGMSPTSAPIQALGFVGSMPTSAALDGPLPYGDDLNVGLGGDGGVIAIKGDTVRVFGGIAGTLTVLPDKYTYWTNTDPEADLTDEGTTVPSGAAFINDAEFKYVMIVAAMPLEGAISIDGTPVYGETLTANTDGITSAAPLGTLSYQWKRGDSDISGANGSTYTLVAADIGSTITVEVSAANYAGSLTSDPTAEVAKKQLTISAPTLTKTKVYDGNTTAAVTAGALSGIVGTEDVSVSAAANYDNKNAETGKTITVIYTLAGADLANYTTPDNDVVNDGEITAKQLTISAPTLTKTKVYDGNTTAAVTAGALSGIVGTEDVSVSVAASYDNKNAGTGKTITVGYTLAGADLANYTTPDNDVVNDGEITAKQLTISAPTLTKTKVYDGNTTAAVTAGTLSGIVGTEDVTVSAAASYDNKNAGTGKTITVVYTLAGADLANYIVPENYVASDGEITAKQLTISTPTLTKTKVYDGNTTAAVTAGNLSGIVGTEDVSVSAAANYDNKNVGTGKAITVVYTLAGADLANYTVPNNDVVNDGEITAKQLTISAPTLTKTKVYDGNTVAAVTAGALSGIVGTEDVSVSAAANYDNKNVGTGKTITVVYTLAGADLANYTVPENYVASDGEITAKQLT